jgi:hypothetical protein
MKLLILSLLFSMNLSRAQSNEAASSTQVAPERKPTIVKKHHQNKKVKHKKKHHKVRKHTN